MPNFGEQIAMNGHCCGCGGYPVPLYKVVRHLERFRCAECTDKERAGAPTQKEA